MLHQLTEISISDSRLETQIHCHHFCGRTTIFTQRNSLSLSVLVSKIKYFVLDLEQVESFLFPQHSCNSNSEAR